MQTAMRPIKWLFEWLAFKLVKLLKSIDNPFKRCRNLLLATSVAIDRRLRVVYTEMFTRNLENIPFQPISGM